ncbi:6321_t:CDS:1, partial [Racocetra persica]
EHLGGDRSVEVIHRLDYFQNENFRRGYIKEVRRFVSVDPV